MSDNRRAKRKSTQEAIEVIDTMTERPIGRVGNMSETGMMLFATQQLPDDALYQISFVLPDDHGRGRPIEIGAHHLWTDAANTPGQFWAGMRFIDISPEDAARLRAWIDRPGGQYV